MRSVATCSHKRASTNFSGITDLRAQDSFMDSFTFYITCNEQKQDIIIR